MDRIVDFSSVDLTKATAQDILQTVDIHKKYDSRMGSGRIAVVIGKEENIGLGRMYEMSLGPNVQAAVRTFRTADEARDWMAEEVAEARPVAPSLSLQGSGRSE